MKCPHCGHEITTQEAARALGEAKSNRKTKSSAENGKKGGRPRRSVTVGCEQTKRNTQA